MANMNSFLGLFGLRKDEPQEKIYNTILVQESTKGVSGTQIYGGVFDEDYLYNMKSVDKAHEYDKVKRDYSAAMLLSAVKSPILGATREVQCAGEDNPEYEKHEILAKKVLFEDIDLDDYISDALTMCEKGYSLFEEAHVPMMEPLLNEEGKTILPSYITLAQPEWRDPKTIYRWNFDSKTRKLFSVTQQAQGDIGGFNDMDARFLNVLTLKKEGQNLEGESLLRPCYGPWLRKNNYLKLNAMAIEKSMPIPTAEIPTGKENSPEFETLKLVFESFTSHQSNYLTWPAGWKVELANGNNYDPSKIEVSIDNEDKRMAMAFLANFLLLGSSGGSGSYALSNDLSDFFLSGETYIANIIEKSINAYIKKVVILNFGKQQKYPKFKFTGITDKAGIEFANMIKLLVDSKVIIPDGELEESVRKRMNLPKASEEDQRVITPAFPEKQMTLSEKIERAIKLRK